ncbi:hypothetical protein BJY01DRAFT_242734 [Aspergillus pseudoustus]|uniref:Myb-like domain-containing protein n=1 Tax=Aspergillus pseudoustus TaxID=1810923 RepID=A0ABR4KWT0_9EURO
MARAGVPARPKRRTLVRWDENLNELLLLTIQSVCNAKDIKIPWAEVASVMQHNTTEGAIVQHLTKLRKRRVEAKKAVPPPLKRGFRGSSSGVSGVSVERNIKENRPDTRTENGESSDEEWVESRGPRRKRAYRGSRTPYTELPKLELEEDSEDSGGELLVPGADFLRLPYDRDQTKEPLSPAPGPEPSLIVALKCPKWFLKSSQDAPLISPPSTSFGYTPTSSYFISRNSENGAFSEDAALNLPTSTSFDQMPTPTSPIFPACGKNAVGHDASMVAPIDTSFAQIHTQTNYFLPGSGNDADLIPYIDYRNEVRTERKPAATEQWDYTSPQNGPPYTDFDQFPEHFAYHDLSSVFPMDFSPEQSFEELLGDDMIVDGCAAPDWKREQ